MVKLYKELIMEEVKKLEKKVRQPWEKMKMVRIGNIEDLVQAGGGKQSIQAPDGPDARKPPGL
jgi:hypothetical protein